MTREEIKEIVREVIKEELKISSKVKEERWSDYYTHITNLILNDEIISESKINIYT